MHTQDLNSMKLKVEADTADVPPVQNGNEKKLIVYVIRSSWKRPLM